MTTIYTPAAPWGGPYPQEVKDNFGNDWEAYGPNQLKKPTIVIAQAADCCLYTTEINTPLPDEGNFPAPDAFSPPGKSVGDTYMICHPNGISMFMCDGAGWEHVWQKNMTGKICAPDVTSLGLALNRCNFATGPGVVTGPQVDLWLDQNLEFSAAALVGIANACCNTVQGSGGANDASNCSQVSQSVNSKATGLRSSAISATNSEITGAFAIVSGNNNKALVASNGFTTGANNQVSGNNSITSGLANVNDGIQGTVTGANNVVSSGQNLVGGNTNTVEGNGRNLYVGTENTGTTGDNVNNVVGGASNTVTGPQNLVVGFDNEALSSQSNLLGGTFNVSEGAGFNTISGARNILKDSGNNQISGQNNDLTTAQQNTVSGGSNSLTGVDRSIVAGFNNTLNNNNPIDGTNDNIVTGRSNLLEGSNASYINGFFNCIKNSTQTMISASSDSEILSGDHLTILSSLGVSAPKSRVVTGGVGPGAKSSGNRTWEIDSITGNITIQGALIGGFAFPGFGEYAVVDTEIEEGLFVKFEGMDRAVIATDGDFDGISRKELSMSAGGGVDAKNAKFMHDKMGNRLMAEQEFTSKEFVVDVEATAKAQKAADDEAAKRAKAHRVAFDDAETARQKAHDENEAKSREAFDALEAARKEAFEADGANEGVVFEPAVYDGAAEFEAAVYEAPIASSLAVANVMKEVDKTEKFMAPVANPDYKEGQVVMQTGVELLGRVWVQTDGDVEVGNYLAAGAGGKGVVSEQRTRARVLEVTDGMAYVVIK